MKKGPMLKIFAWHFAFMDAFSLFDPAVFTSMTHDCFHYKLDNRFDIRNGMGGSKILYIYAYLSVESSSTEKLNAKFRQPFTQPAQIRRITNWQYDSDCRKPKRL